MTTAHPFAPIAPAPYRLVSVVKSADEVKAGRLQVQGVCEHCGSVIINVVTFRGADGREFTVGLDCAKKARENPADHVKRAKAEDVMASYASSWALLVSQGAHIEGTHGKPAAKLVRDFKPLAKLGLVQIAKQLNRFGEQTAVRVIFTQAGVDALGATAGLRCPLQVGDVPEGWALVA